MAEAHIELEQRQQHLEQRIDKSALVFQELRKRVSRLEQQLDPAYLITDEQQAAVLNAVKGLAILMTGRDGKITSRASGARSTGVGVYRTISTSGRGSGRRSSIFWRSGVRPSSAWGIPPHLNRRFRFSTGGVLKPLAKTQKEPKRQEGQPGTQRSPQNEESRFWLGQRQRGQICNPHSLMSNKLAHRHQYDLLAYLAPTGLAGLPAHRSGNYRH